MSDTPRTDKLTFDIEAIRGDAHLGRHVYPCGSGDFVESDFARQLERELNAANKENKRLREWIGSLEELEANDTDRRKWATPSTWLPAGLKIYLGGNQP